MSRSRSAQDDVLRLLAGRPCLHCDEGTLERTTYRSNAAVVCDECGTPRVQVW